MTSPATRSERNLGLTLRIFCVLPFATGLMDMLVGLQPLAQFGAFVPHATATDPTVGSQVGFWGGIWFGWGVFLWWAAADVRQHAVPVRIAAATLFLAGLGRAYAAVRFGMPTSVLIGATGLELIGSPVIWWWLSRVG